MGAPQLQASAVGAGLQYNAVSVSQHAPSAEHERLRKLVGGEVGVEAPNPNVDPAQTTEWATATPGQPVASAALA